MQQRGGNVEQGTGARRCSDRDGDLEWKGVYGVGGRKDICLGVIWESERGVVIYFLRSSSFSRQKQTQTRTNVIKPLPTRRCLIPGLPPLDHRTV